MSVLGFAVGRDGERGTGIRWLIGQMAWQSGTETGKETLGGTGGNDEVSYKFSEVRHKKLTRQSKAQKFEVAKRKLDMTF